MSAPQSGLAQYHESLTPLLIDVAAVRPHSENPRNGDIEAIAESISVNGCYRPLYVQRSTGMILAGNHTYHALLSLGATEVPVLWLDVDDLAAKRILAADNRLADLGGYDNGLLVDLLDKIAQQDSLVGTGYTDTDLSDLHALIAQDKPIDLGPEERGWPILHIRVPPQARSAFYSITDSYSSDTERFMYLLRKGGWNG